MSLKTFINKQKKSLRAILAASAIFAGGLSTANAAEQRSVPKTPEARQKANIQNWQRTFARIDAVCLKHQQKNLIEREGDKDHLYLDSKGILHTGVGLNINDYESFKQLDFIGKNNKLLSEREKRAYFSMVKNFQKKQAKLGFNYKASYYARHLTIRPTKESRDRLFKQRMLSSKQAIKNMLGEKAYYNLHPIAQSEIIMMHYNMGSDRFNPKKWPKFFDAARQADYMTMSQECHTKSISEDRNQKIASAFKNLSKTKWYAYGRMYNQPHKNAATFRQTKTM